MSKYLQKANTFRQVIKENGGIIGSFLTFFRTDELKTGKLVGTDEFGNKYFENNYYFYGRNRWVMYDAQFGFDYDASQVPAEWHRWLHYIGDSTPVDKAPFKKDWMAKHTENNSGSNDIYVPYSTTVPKIESWTPPKKS